jgi:hypothetical protein
VTDLERLFRLLVQQLAGSDPGRLHRPMSIAELSRDVVPYRSSRRMLAIETAEDHEALLLRLVSGEGNFVQLLHDEIRRRFEVEARSANPDLALLREFAKAQFLISTEPLARALGDGIVLAPAPAPTPAPIPPPMPALHRPALGNSIDVSLDEVRLSMPELDEIVARHASPLSAPPQAPAPAPLPGKTPAPRVATTARCGFCGGALPAGRAINFCPHCGQNQSLSFCPSCQADVETGWHHCVSCGQALAS